MICHRLKQQYSSREQVYVKLRFFLTNFLFFFSRRNRFFNRFLKNDFSLYLKSSFRRPMMETGGSCGIRGLMYPLIPSVSHKRWRRRATEEMRGHYIVPRLADWMRTVTHVEGMAEPRTISVQVQPRTVQVTPLTCTVSAMLLILISDA